MCQAEDPEQLEKNHPWYIENIEHFAKENETLSAPLSNLKMAIIFGTVEGVVCPSQRDQFGASGITNLCETP